jgi:hypothetical protein
MVSITTFAGTHSRHRAASPPDTPPAMRWSLFAWPKEATPSSGERTPFDVAIHSDREGVKGITKRCLQWATTTIDHDDGNDGEVGGSGVRSIPTAAGSDKRQAMPPMNHFKRLLEEAYPNHVYPVRHKLKDCSMMRSYMTSGASPGVWSSMKARTGVIRRPSSRKMLS